MNLCVEVGSTQVPFASILLAISCVFISFFQPCKILSVHDQQTVLMIFFTEVFHHYAPVCKKWSIVHVHLWSQIITRLFWGVLTIIRPWMRWTRPVSLPLTSSQICPLIGHPRDLHWGVRCLAIVYWHWMRFLSLTILLTSIRCIVRLVSVWFCRYSARFRHLAAIALMCLSNRNRNKNNYRQQIDETN